MKRILITLAGWFLLGFSVLAQSHVKALKTSLNTYFAEYETSYSTPRDRCKMKQLRIDSKGRRLHIYADDFFSGQSFDDEKVKRIYNDIKELLPKTYKKYKITVYGDGTPIEHLVTSIHQTSTGKFSKRWETCYEGAPWVQQSHLPYSTQKGMQGRHIAVSTSHGIYYKNEQGTWKWQRPHLYCTTEDLFTQTITVPFLIPMLENSGACVFTPRERDWQEQERIVDNDTPDTGGTFTMLKGEHAWKSHEQGFAHFRKSYRDLQNPFNEGSSCWVETVKEATQASFALWKPSLEQEGRYAVYVTYPDLPTNVPDVKYEVCHQGIHTSFRVNQQMGGGTWTYLGTFDFGTDPEKNYVTLSNESAYKGTVGADAVRFGGGMGNTARGPFSNESTSGLPRYLEGARYNAAWSGMPYSVVSSKEGSNDYADDINVRSLMINYLAGGSVYLPCDSGLRVPLEMVLALHSDAGIANDSIRYIGTLGVVTTDYQDKELPSGVSRFTSRDLCDIVMEQVTNDLTAHYGKWRRRQIYDRNYSESRIPEIPSMILEVLSHQNFHDMVKGHDPMFKFHLARAIYKGVLRYTSAQRQTDYIVHPLPVNGFATAVNSKSQEIELSWAPTPDALEPTAAATGYVVYTRKGNDGYDNGTYVKQNRWSVKAEPNTVYSFKVVAVNEGGKSFPSAELCAMVSSQPKAAIMIIDGFQRVAGPQVVYNDTQRGFDMTLDPGVPYMKSPGFCGNQTMFDITDPSERESWGGSGSELEGQMIAGNTFSHSLIHGEAIAASGAYSFASATRSAVENGTVHLMDYHVVDLILGLQKNDGYSTEDYSTLPPALCNALREFTRTKGHLMVSGAYIARDQRTKEQVDFINSTLKIASYAPLRLDPATTIQGMNTSFDIYQQLNREHYAVTHADCFMPSPEAFTTLLFAPEGYSAAVAYKGHDYNAVTLGFPFECIRHASDRDRIMDAFLTFLLSK